MMQDDLQKLDTKKENVQKSDIVKSENVSVDFRTVVKHGSVDGEESIPTAIVVGSNNKYEQCADTSEDSKLNLSAFSKESAPLACDLHSNLHLPICIPSFNSKNLVIPELTNDENSTALYPSDLPEDYRNQYKSFITKIQHSCVPIIESIKAEHIAMFQHYFTRQYSDRYFVDFNTNKPPVIFQDILIRVHTNGTLLIALAPGNSIMMSPKKITKLNFDINNKDRSQLKIRGKNKIGAKFLKPETIICEVQLENDSTKYKIRAGVKGRLVEMNAHVIAKPNLMKTNPKGIGYICMLLPNAPIEKITDSVDNLTLLNETAYHNFILSRSQNG